MKIQDTERVERMACSRRWSKKIKRHADAIRTGATQRQLVDLLSHTNDCDQCRVALDVASSAAQKERSDEFVSGVANIVGGVLEKYDQIIRSQPGFSTAPNQMSLRDDEYARILVEGMSLVEDPCIVHYAERWARFMEGAIAQGATIAECAEDASELAGRQSVSHAEHYRAGLILAWVWIHSVEFLLWQCERQSQQ